MTTTSPPSPNGATPLPNRAARRRGGSGRPGAGSHIPVRIANAFGAEVMLAGEPYHLAVLTAYGVSAAQTFIEKLDPNYYPAPGATGGATLVSGCIRVGAWAVLRELLGWCIAEELPPDIEQMAAPGEMADVLDAAWASWGMDWLGELLKNCAARAERRLTETLAQIDQHEIAAQAVMARVNASPPPGGTDGPPDLSPPSPSTLPEPADT